MFSPQMALDAVALDPQVLPGSMSADPNDAERGGQNETSSGSDGEHTYQELMEQIGKDFGIQKGENKSGKSDMFIES